MTTALSAPDPCPHCGGDGVELLEGWSLLSAEFMVDACCERAQDDFLSEWDSPDALNALGLGDLLGSPVRAVHHDGLQAIIDARLSLGSISQREARAFIAGIIAIARRRRAGSTGSALSTRPVSSVWPGSGGPLRV